MKSFIDANIFLYAIDLRETTKRNKSLALLRLLVAEGEGVISSQVVNEFSFNVLSKFRRSATETKEMFGLFVGFEYVPHSLEMSLLAIDVSDSSKVNYWDATLVAAARTAKCSTLYTEDLSHGQTIEGIKIVNPFA